MNRRKITIAPGTLVPIIRGPWSAAKEKLQEVKLGISQMQDAQDRIQFEQGWIRCLDSLEEFWNRFFDEGKTRFSNFQPWAGGIDKERKDDDLLRYLYQARHQSQHGRIALDWSEGSFDIAPGFFGTIRNLGIFSDGTFEMDEMPAHPSVPKASVVFSGGNAKLPIIYNEKFKQTFQPPIEHCGIPLRDRTPINVMIMALRYYDHILFCAIEKFDHQI